MSASISRQAVRCATTAAGQVDGGLASAVEHCNLHLLAGEPADDRLDVCAGQSGQNPAIHHRAGELRQGVVRVPRVDFCGHTRGAKLCVEERRSREPGGGGKIGRQRGDGAHVDRGLSALGSGQSLEKHPRHVVHMQRELVVADASERGGERIDRIIGPDERAVAADVGHFELIVRVDFFARLHFEDSRPAVSKRHATAIGVESQIAASMSCALFVESDWMLFVLFFVSSQGDDQIALGLPPRASSEKFPSSIAAPALLSLVPRP